MKGITAGVLLASFWFATIILYLTGQLDALFVDTTPKAQYPQQEQNND